MKIKSSTLRRQLRHISLLIALFVTAIPCMIADSVRELPTKEINGKQYYYYQVKPKDTFFSLTRSLGVSRTDIETFNPATIDGLKAYSTLYFPVEKYGAPVKTETTETVAAEPIAQQDKLPKIEQTEENPAPATITSNQGRGRLYKIQKGQSLYGIAYANNISVDDLLAANPGISAKSYKAGTVIVIPDPDAEEIEVSLEALDQMVEDEADMEAEDEDEDDSTDDEEDADEMPTGGIDFGPETEIPTDTLRIAVMLPLEIEKSEPTRTARLFTEFYRGFLLGADNLSRSGQPVEITLYDTSDSTAFVSRLSQPIMKEYDLFIGPETPWGLQSVARKAQSDSAWIINPFSVKDTQQKKTARLFQANIPHTEMYDGAIDRFMSQFEGYVPVFIGRVDGSADKAPFTEQLKATLDKNKIEYKVIAFHSVLTSEELQDLRTDTATVFIPMSSSRTEFAKISPALKDFYGQTLADGGKSAMFGYPEWIAFRGEYLDQLGDLNATIYSRFYSPTGDYLARHVATDYARWFGEDMTDAVPNQALLGFDIALYAVNSLRENGGALIAIDPDGEEVVYDGLQSSFRPLLKPGEKGWTNHALYFITFAPGGSTHHEIVTVPVKSTK